MKQKNTTKFFFRPSDSMFAYCSHCGRAIPQDHYNMIKHGRKCNFDSHDIYEILGKNNYGYDLQQEGSDILVLTVYKPFLKQHAVYQDRFIGTWEPLYQARFKRNSRFIKEQGLLNFEEWEKLIHEKKIIYLGKKHLHRVISSVFPVIPYIYNLRMFFYIYRHKGYTVTDYKPDASTTNKYGTPRKEEHLSDDVVPDKNLRIYGELLTDSGHTLLAIRVYHTRPGTKITDYYSFFVGENIFYPAFCTSKKPEFFHSLLTNNAKCYISCDDLTQFSTDCPSICLQNYLKGGGKNILIPLIFSTNFHKGLELLAKSGNSWYAEHFFKKDAGLELHLFKKEPSPESYSTVTDLLGLPKALLGTPASPLFADENVRHRLAYIFHTNRRLIEGISYTSSVIHFLTTQDVTHDHSVTRNQIMGITDLSDPELRKILIYLSKLAPEFYETYRDYLNMVHISGVYDYGYCPKDLRLAHNDLARTLDLRRNMQNEEAFRIAVSLYKNLETSPGTNDTNHAADNETGKETDDPFSLDSYFIRCPKDISDLNTEGRNQHNCVASYLSWIIKGDCQILFMRDKKKPETSLVTIEVRDHRLIQVKAPYNKTAASKCQKFILKWCKLHKISYKSCRDITISSVA